MFCTALLLAALAAPVRDSSPLIEKAKYFQQDLLEKHWLDGLYVSIVNVVPPGAPRRHTVDEPGNVIHAGVWTGRYLAGVGYQYAVTRDPWVRKHGGEILRALRIQQEITGKPGLLARGYVKGHGPVEDWERDGRDSKEWRQGQGRFADYRWYGDVSVDNLNAVLYGYAVYHDLAADAAQKKMIAEDVDRLMTHLLDNHCRIIDVDGEVTQWGHVGIDPDPSRDEYYKKVYSTVLARRGIPTEAAWRPPLRASLMLLPDLLIAHHITGKQRYLDFYRRVIERFKDNPDIVRNPGPYSLEKVARTDHSSEGQAYEALYNLIRYEHDPELLKRYRPWLDELWEMNWMEGNALFTFMTLALTRGEKMPHRDESLRLAVETLKLYPVDRVFRPVMNSIRKDVEMNPHSTRLTAKVLPINQRPLDNEYTWKGNPYQADGWLKPTVTAMQFACDDPMVAWFADSTGRLYMTRDGWKTWENVSAGLMGANVRNITASKTRTFILYAQTDKGIFVTRDGGLSWRETSDHPEFPTPAADGRFQSPRGAVTSGPKGAYLSRTELKLWREQETGAADFLHAYWMGRYYAFITP